MRLRREAGAFACFFCVTALAQAPVPAFELADVRVSPHTANSYLRSGMLPGGRYEIRGATMVDLIKMAWGIDDENVFGGPGWLAADRFDIAAKVAPASTEADRALMLRALLADRFKLVTHDDTKPVASFVLTVVKRNAAMKQSAEEGKESSETNMEQGPPVYVVYSGRHVTMEAFARMLRDLDNQTFNHQVIDATGLKGAWDFTFKFTRRGQLQRAMVNGQADPGISITDALEKQLGLKAEAQKRSLPVIVVDSVNRAPTENAPSVTKNLPAAPTEFEVADIKPSKPGQNPTGGFKPGGRIDLQNFTLKQLIGIGWDVDDEKTILGGPKWLETDRFDIVAKAPSMGPGNDFPPDDTLTLMLRTLLAERFQIKTHTEDQPVAVYELLPGKKAHRLKEADPQSRSGCKLSLGQSGTGAASIPLRIYTCQNTTMSQFAELIRPVAAAYIDHPVVDMTGIKGGWDFSVSWTGKGMVQAAKNKSAENGESADPTGARTVFESIDKELGLRLEGGKKQPQPVLVVDHVEPLAAAK